MVRRIDLTRDQSFSARPMGARIVARQTLPGGGERVTVEQEPTGAYRWLLRLPRVIRKKFELDAIGVEVLGMCDGETSVKRIVERFTREHGVHPHEGRRAVTAFLETMMRKGLVTMVVGKAGGIAAGDSGKKKRR